MREYMNEPEKTDGQAYLSVWREQFWVTCPQCGKRQFPVSKDSKIANLIYTCKNTQCKYQMIINV